MNASHSCDGHANNAGSPFTPGDLLWHERGASSYLVLQYAVLPPYKTIRAPSSGVMLVLAAPVTVKDQGTDMVVFVYHGRVLFDNVSYLKSHTTHYTGACPRPATRAL